MEIERQNCTLCGPRAGRTLKYRGNAAPKEITRQNFSPRNLKVRHHFDFVECDHCGILFSDTVLSARESERLYKASVLEDEPELGERYETLERFIFDSYVPVLDRATGYVASRKRFVEVGGGSGFMLRYGADNAFAEQWEVELCEEASKRFTPPSKGAKFVRATLESSGLPAGSASLVCFFQMLDHARNPRDFLAKVYDALEPGGVAVCVVHDTSAMPNRLLGRRSPILNVLHHYLFNPTNLPRLFEAVGFKVAETFPVANRYPLWYWLYLLPLPESLKQKAKNVLEGLGLAEMRINLYAGNLGVVAVKPSVS